MKKLTLNKETIANLNKDQASEIIGGGVTQLPIYTCQGSICFSACGTCTCPASTRPDCPTAAC